MPSSASGSRRSSPRPGTAGSSAIAQAPRALMDAAPVAEPTEHVALHQAPALMGPAEHGELAMRSQLRASADVELFDDTEDDFHWPGDSLPIQEPAAERQGAIVPMEEDGLELWGEEGSDLSEDLIPLGDQLVLSKMQRRARDVDDLSEESEEAPPFPALPSLGVCIYLCVAGGLILVFVLVNYAFADAREAGMDGAEYAAGNAELHLAEILAPTTAVATSVDIAFRGGYITTITEFLSLSFVLEPHLEANPHLSEVEVVAEPPVGHGSVVARMGSGGLLELSTDQAECVAAQGDSGAIANTCAWKPRRANQTRWFEQSLNYGVSITDSAAFTTFLAGPVFVQQLPHESTCGDYCWASTVSGVSRVAGSVPPPLPEPVNESELPAVMGPTVAPTPFPAPPPWPRVTVRASVAAAALAEVAARAGAACRGEAFISTKDGDLVAAKDMGDTILVDGRSGVARARRVWELDREWARGLTRDFVSGGKGGDYTLENRIMVSSWRYEDPVISARQVDSLRIVLAVPEEEYTDKILYFIHGFVLFVGITMLSITALATFWFGALWLRDNGPPGLMP